MKPADLLFIVLFLTAVFSLLTAAGFAVRLRFGRARRILFRLLVCAGAYMAVVIAVSGIAPRRTVRLGDSQCFDDWCVVVAGFRRAPEDRQIRYTVDLRLFSRARRISQRENNVAVYLTDARGRRYDSLADESAVPFNVLLGPGESIMASRAFVVPADAARVGVVVAHEGGFPIGWFILGYDTWFRKPPVAILE
jgi:hypothetical protein